jgi:RNA polymerase sigma factor (sigma-70 family)
MADHEHDPANRPALPVKPGSNGHPARSGGVNGSLPQPLSMTTATDEQLVEAYKRAVGDSARVFAELFVRYERTLANYLHRHRRFLSSQDLEDIGAEVWVRFAKYVSATDEFREDGAFRRWLFKTVGNLVIDFRNSRWRQRAQLTDDEEQLSQGANQPTPAELAEQQEITGTRQQFVDALKQTQANACAYLSTLLGGEGVPEKKKRLPGRPRDAEVLLWAIQDLQELTNKVIALLE